ncbi:adenylate/guanylate cyclase domain-containing protein [Legionella fallonii]|uniref:Putative adenylate cyclase 1 n=1 Tax=Legionella fallonii LLAP-10 TaxID=1212491 RepID=A0A098G4T5_9GAMM|nr:adenylate/guanylate cyclase domain-containing protein [Legionella fallonii]CEG56500.1 putative adenylate cyclase 1 [Legionella fallonii LLAP-10]
MIERLYKKINEVLIPLRSSMLFIFISLFVTTTLLIILVTALRYTEALSNIAHQRMRNASLIVLNRLHANIAPAQIHCTFIAHLIEQDFIYAHEAQIAPLIMDIVKILPLVNGAYWGNQDGDFIYAKRELDGSITSEFYRRSQNPATRTIINRDIHGKIIRKYLSSNLSYDHRGRPWYVLAQKEKKTSWSDVYLFEDPPIKGITVSSPVFKNGVFWGAVGIDINLSELSQFVKSQKITPNSYLFIVNKEEKFIAYPNLPSFTNLATTNGVFNKTDVSPNSLIDQTLKKYQQLGGERKRVTFSYSYDNQVYMVTYVPSKIFAAYGWLVGVVALQTDFISNLKKMHLITIYISLTILMLGIFLVSGLVSHIVKPLKTLVAETENIKQFNLDNKIAITSKIKEVIQLKNAVDSMKLGLKLFQKYIPKVLVKQLIASGEDIRTGGVRKNLTILFSDIQHFTTIAEKIEPNLLMAQMGEYFEELTRVIIDEQGTIDKYIGDSIMAFWGAPLPNAHPCHRAAKAALRCQKKLDTLNEMWLQKGGKAFITRIGIHMGDAIVGNLGSSERLNYTAIGDAINVASRLESINKNYQTRIIVSDIVYEQIKDKFALRMIDHVVVKGRTQSCYIYELLTDDIKNLEFDLNAYNSFFEQGFLAYKQQSWDEAIVHFKKCVEIYPSDTIAPIFIGRCQQFKSTPPKADWDGIME